MTTYYVWSGATGSATGADWTNAVTTLTAGLALATSTGDVLKIASDHVEIVAADITYTWTAAILTISINRGSGAFERMVTGGGYIGHNSSNRSVLLNSPAGISIYGKGLKFIVVGGSPDHLRFNGGGQVYEDCTFIMNNASALARVMIGYQDISAHIRFKNCAVEINGDSANGIALASNFVMEGGSISGASTSLFVLPPVPDLTGSTAVLSGVDLSGYSMSYIAGDFISTAAHVTLSNCAMPASWSGLAPQTNGLAGAEVWLFNCAYGDNHYHFGHYNAAGQTVAVTSPYADDGALYDGTNHVTWQITTSSLVSEYTPYISPWIERYHSAASAITPSLEILRNDSATAFKDNEVWGEWSYQGASGKPLALMVNDRASELGTPANQEAGVGLTGWTGESGTAWSGKLTCPSITPAEIGPLRARVCVGLASTTVFVDPTIRGAV